MKRKKIVYVQHAPSLGGSVISLKELIIDASQNGYECTVICPNNEIAEYYQLLGAKTYVSILAPFNHNTAYFYKLSPVDLLRIFKVFLKTVVSFFLILRILRKENPDVVHLNSSTLILYSALCFMLRVPNIIHVRETIVKGYCGFRRRLLVATANTFSNFVIFISEFEHANLPTRNSKSVIVYNYVHLNEFIDGTSLTAPRSEKITFITLGGFFSLKGGHILLKALAGFPSPVELLVLGGNDPREAMAELSGVESAGYSRQIIQLLESNDLRGKVRIVGKVLNPSAYIAQANALIFWAAAPHFPRPVFEAWLLRKPVLYFNPDYRNPLIDSGNIIPIENKSEVAAREAMHKLSSYHEASSQRADESFATAVQNFTEKNFVRINDLYRRCLIK